MEEPRRGAELRVYLLIEDLQRQFAAYLGTPTRARGYPALEGTHALIVEVAPALAIERITDLALKAVPAVEPGLLYVERQFGILEVHGYELDDVRRAGEAILEGIGARSTDQLRPRTLFVDVIEDIGDQHAIILNRTREASMVMPGETLLVYDRPGTVRQRRRQRGRARGSREHACERLDDRRRRPRLHQWHDSRGHPGPGRDLRPAGGARGPGSVTQAYTESDLPHLQRVAQAALARWGLDSASELRLINLSENATYTVRPPDAPTPVILRVGRPEYSTVQEIDSELSWVEALATDRVVLTAPVLRTVDGSRVAEIAIPELPAPRPCVAFGFVPGEEAPEDGDLTLYFRTLGALTARLHAHARGWCPPPGFVRRTWDYDTTIGDRAHWGAWQDGIGVGDSERSLLQRLQVALAERLDEYGKGSDRFGLVHADLRLANVLFDGDDAYVIDFDDSGFSWFMYDLASCSPSSRIARTCQHW